MSYQNRLYLYWYIGKSVYEQQNLYDNVVEKYSKYYSYHYGNSYLFTRSSIKMMLLFYLNFPIFSNQMKIISWNQYLLLLTLPSKEMYFYFYLSLFFQSDYQETYDFIQNNYYVRI